MPKILFTHKINAKHLNILKEISFEFDSIPLIDVETNDFDVLEVKKSNVDAWIFTSKKAVESLARKIDLLTIPKLVFAVGSSTNEKLANLGINTIIPNHFTSTSLTQKIIEYPVDSCSYFRGNMTSSDLSKSLRENDIAVNEIEVYKTSLTPKKVNIKGYDAFVFLSPSAFTSFCKENDPGDLNTVFCIGSTTAEAVKKKHQGPIITPSDFTFSELVKTINQKFQNVIS